MLAAISMWMVTVPVEAPFLRASLIVVEIVVLALALHGLWELGFSVSEMLRRRVVAPGRSIRAAAAKAAGVDETA